jgi:dsDNA-specific endonuclease/ATPase MutS2
MATTFKTGDKVSALDDAFGGTVRAVEGDVITVETDDGFYVKYLSKELIKNHDTSNLSKSIGNFNSAEIRRLKDPVKKAAPAAIRVKGEIPPPEFDLHIEKLVRNPRSLSHYDILTLQSDTAKRHIEFAIRNRIPKIILIHGVGEGILKSELDFLLSRYENVVFRDADYRKYGVGATEVIFKQSAK